MKNIINEQNYEKYIHYLESNLIGLSFLKIFKYRILSSLKCFLYIEKTGDLSIEEQGTVSVKKSNIPQDYLLTKMNDTSYYSLFLKNSNTQTKINLNNYSVVRHKLFKNFYLIYPNKEKLLNYIAKEGKVNLLFLLFIIVFCIIGVLVIIGII